MPAVAAAGSGMRLAAAGTSTADSRATSTRSDSTGWMVGTSSVSGAGMSSDEVKSSMLGSTRRSRTLEAEAEFVVDGGSASGMARALRAERRRSHRNSTAMNTAPRTINATRSWLMMFGRSRRSNGGQPHGLVHVHTDQARHARLVHGHAHQLLCQLHGGLVVGDEDELHAAGHLAHDIAEAAHIVLVQRRVHFVQQTERRGVQVEDGEHQCHGGQRLLAAGELRDRAVALAGWARHDGNAGRQHVLASEFEVGMTTAEQPREFFLQAVVDLLKRSFEAGARLPVDLAHGLFERIERISEVFPLRVEKLLAL